jgi:hypothetical protein
MAYRIKGGKLAKNRPVNDEWTALFDGPLPAAIISRPGRRPLAGYRYTSVMAAHIAERVSAGEPAMCFKNGCPIEFQAMPECFAVLRMTADGPPLTMGICPECARSSDAEIIAILREQFKKFGVGVGTDSKIKRVKMEIPITLVMDVLPGLKIAVAAESESETPCDVANMLADLLHDRKLLRFMAFRRGAHNCHAIVNQLRLDLKAIGIDDQFSYKRGSSAVIANDCDAKGLHSWLERDGWAIDISGGALDNPIMLQRVVAFYDRYQLTDIHDIEH